MSCCPAGGTRRSVGVVVPARDEEGTIVACLRGLARAASALDPACTVDVVVVLDGCRDRTEDLVRAVSCQWATAGCGPALRSVRTDGGNVGAARARGCAAVDPRAAWLATTDADSVVPDHWLAHQLALADAGADVWLGTVTTSGLYHPCATAWDLLERSDHPYVHGANMGLSPVAYAASGGFAPLVSGEDVDLARRLQAAGWKIVRGLGAPVTTSGRMVGRAPAGYAADRAAGWPAPPDLLGLGLDPGLRVGPGRDPEAVSSRPAPRG